MNDNDVMNESTNKLNNIDKKCFFQYKKYNNYILLLLIIILIMGIIIFLILYYIRNNNNNNSYYIQKNCDSGYYYPNNDNINQKCKQCSINGCEKCYGNNITNICISCKNDYIPIYENNKIKYCKYPFDDEEIEKCLEYDINNQCNV